MFETGTKTSEISEWYKYGTGVEEAVRRASYFRLIVVNPKMSLKYRHFKLPHMFFFYKYASIVVAFINTVPNGLSDFPCVY